MTQEDCPPGHFGESAKSLWSLGSATAAEQGFWPGGWALSLGVQDRTKAWELGPLAGQVPGWIPVPCALFCVLALPFLPERRSTLFSLKSLVSQWIAKGLGTQGQAP